MDRRRETAAELKGVPPQLSSACTRIAALACSIRSFSHGNVHASCVGLREGSLGVRCFFPSPHRGAGGGPIPREVDSVVSDFTY